MYIYIYIYMSIPYGVFVSLLHRAYRICSSPSFFRSRVADMIEVFLSKGCSANRLLRNLHDFLQSRCPLRWNIKWGKLFSKIQSTVKRNSGGSSRKPRFWQYLPHHPTKFIFRSFVWGGKIPLVPISKNFATVTLRPFLFCTECLCICVLE